MTPANQAIEEIKVILLKYDLAGMVTVQAPDELAYLLKIDTSWSCMWLEDVPGEKATRLRFRSRRDDYPSPEAFRKAREDSVGAVLSFHAQAERNITALEEVIAMIAHHFPDVMHIETQNE